MVILAGTPGADISTILASLPQLRRSSEELVRTPRTVDPGEVSSLYVGQREMAVLTPADGIEVLGSDSATTCHVVILRWGGVTGLGHIDTPSEDLADNQLSQLVEATLQRGPAWPGDKIEMEVSMFGGYNDEAGVSGGICRMILRSLELSEVTFTLSHFCCSDINTASARPIVFGGAVELRSGRVFCAEFSKRTPHMDIRSLRLYSSQAQSAQLGMRVLVDQFPGYCCRERVPVSRQELHHPALQLHPHTGYRRLVLQV